MICFSLYPEYDLREQYVRYRKPTKPSISLLVNYYFNSALVLNLLLDFSDVVMLGLIDAIEVNDSVLRSRRQTQWWAESRVRPADEWPHLQSIESWL